MEITLKIFTSLPDFKPDVVQDQPETVQVVNNALQTTIDSLFKEDLSSITGILANTLSQHTTLIH